MKDRGKEHLQTAGQVLAILLLAGLVGMVLHKGYADFSALAQQNPGESFLPALVRYLFRNLAG